MAGPTILHGDAPPSAALRCANLEIRPGERQALAAGRPLDLTSREFQLLLALAQRRNRVVARGDLYELVWRGRMAYRDRSVDVFVRKLRLKLGDASPGWSTSTRTSESGTASRPSACCNALAPE